MREKFFQNLSFELKRVRENCNYTIDKVAEQTGYSRPLISRYENGKVVDLNILLSLLEFYNARIDLFFEKVYAYTYSYKDSVLENNTRQDKE